MPFTLRFPALFMCLAFVLTAGAGAASQGETPPIFQTLRKYHPGKRVAVDYSRVGQNRFRNAGFEQTKGDDVAHWLTVGVAAATPEPVRSGSRALLLRNPTWPRTDGRVVQNVTGVQGGASYRATVYMRSPKGARNVNIKFEVYTSAGKYLGGFRSEHFTISDRGGWTRIEYTHKLPPSPSLRVCVLFRLWDPGPLLLDDASFSLVEQKPLYLPANVPGARLLQTRDLLAWTAPLPTRIPSDYPVDADKARLWPGGRLQLRLAGNETGILPLFLTAMKSDLADVSVRVETDEPDAAKRYDLALYTVEPFQYLGDLYYDVLVPARPFALPAGKSKMVWLNIYMPPGAKRRGLKGTLVLSAKGMEARRVPFAIETFGFDLPHEPSLPFSVGIPRPGRRVRPGERRQWLRDIARHRLSIRHLAAPTLRFEGGKPVCDFTAFDAELEWARGLGMNLFQLPWAYVATGHGKHYTQRFGPIREQSISDEFRRKFVNAMRALAEHLEEKGVLDRFNHNLFDEPYPKHFAQLRELGLLLRQANPRYRPSAYGGGRAAADGVLAGIIEEPIGAGWDPEVREILRRRGTIVAVYNPVQAFDVTRRPELARGFAWWAWRCGMDRVYHWCICPHRTTMHTSDYGNAWVFENPGHHAFLSTVRFEMLREGLEDYDYLTLFQRALDDAARRLAVKGVDTREIADFFAAQLSERQFVKQCTDPAKYERMRRFLGKAIEDLPKPPLVLFRISQGKEHGRTRVELWTEPGAHVRVSAGQQSAVLGSGTAAFEATPGPAGMIDLVVTKDNPSKRLRIPVR